MKMTRLKADAAKVSVAVQANEPETVEQQATPNATLGQETPRLPPELVRTIPAAVGTVDNRQAAKSRLSVRGLRSAQAALDRGRFQQELTQLVIQDCSSTAQEHFVDWLAERYPPAAAMTRDLARELGWILSKLRRSAGVKAETGAVAAFFRERGFRFDFFDELPPGNLGFQIDRRAFSAHLTEIAEASGKVSKAIERHLLVLCRDLVDNADIYWTMRQVKIAQLKKAIDPAVATRLVALLAAKNPGSVDINDVAKAVRDMRRSGFSADTVADFKKLMDRNTTDSDALLCSERIVRSGIEHALSRARDPADLARLRAARAELASYFAPRIAGTFDRRGHVRRLSSLWRDGVIDRTALEALRATVYTSATHSEFARGVSYVRQSLTLEVALADLLHEAFEEYVKAWAEAGSTDTYDAHGRPIETADEAQLKRRLAELLTLLPEVMRAKALRAVAAARIDRALSAISRANLRSERQQFVRELAMVLVGNDELAEPAPKAGAVGAAGS